MEHEEYFEITEDGYAVFNGKKYRLYRGPRIEGPRDVILLGSSRYPEPLKNIPYPPKRLYCIGDISALGDALAVIGARKATPYGLACAERFAGEAAQRGITIVSGGAMGCDSRAHRAALDASGRTVAVLGGGCDQVYPASNVKLFQEIVDTGGVVLSERPWGFPALPFTFRQRNRIIAGLARAVLIVEAGLPSGTFSTADEALMASRDVLVVPGAITSHTSAGSNRLLYQGATPVVDDETFQDVLFSLYGTLKQEDGTEVLEEGKDPLLEALMAEPMRIDTMIDVIKVPKRLGKPEVWITKHLVELESAGRIARYPDGRYGPAKV